MRILFLHQNFPAQFLHLAPALQARGHEVLALTPASNASPQAVPTVRYKWQPRKIEMAAYQLATTYAEMVDRAQAIALVCLGLRDKHKYVPDVIFGHIGWGETLLLKDVWPTAKLLLYSEFFYDSGLSDFDTEFEANDFSNKIWIRSRQSHLLQAIHTADRFLAPTAWQAGTFPAHARSRMSVIHDGIDTAAIKPDSGARFEVAGSPHVFKAGDEVLTFVGRALEPYRGFHIFMRALPEVLKARPNAHVVIAGGEGEAYGRAPPGGQTWAQIFLHELNGRLDLSRVHFTGHLPFDAFLNLVHVSRVHAYLSYPFVLSWSMLQAMSAGAYVVGSRTPPVEEVIRDGVNGRLIDFFDVAAWSDALIEGLAHPERNAAMRAAGRRTVVEGYDLSTVSLPKLIAFVEGAGI